jgi:hypothetical protein
LPIADRGNGPRCTRIKLNGERCKLPPIKGGTVCGSHGGRSPQVRRKAAERLAEAKAIKQAKAELVRQGRTVPPAVNPLDVLEDVLAETVHLKSRLAGLVDRLSDDSLRYEGKTGEQMRAELAVYRGLLQDVVKTAETLVKLGIAERKVRVQEAEAMLLLGCVRAILEDLNLSREQKQLAAESVPRRLREVSEPKALASPAHNPGDRRRR